MIDVAKVATNAKVEIGRGNMRVSERALILIDSLGGCAIKAANTKHYKSVSVPANMTNLFYYKSGSVAEPGRLLVANEIPDGTHVKVVRNGGETLRVESVSGFPNHSMINKIVYNRGFNTISTSTESNFIELPGKAIVIDATNKSALGVGNYICVGNN